MPKAGAGQFKIPYSVQAVLGGGRLEKGSWNDIFLITWDFADKCIKKECPMYNVCDYHKRETRNGVPSDKCFMQQRYLRNVIAATMQKMDKRKGMTQENVIKLGYHILPLYAQLFKFKMMEYQMKSSDLVYISEKGTPKVHPIYKEIREIVKAIEGVWRGIEGMGGTKGSKASADIGDDAYVDAMYEVMGEEPFVEEAKVEEDDGKGVAMDFDSVGIPDEKPKRIKDQSSNNKRKSAATLHKKKPTVKKTRKKRS